MKCWKSCKGKAWFGSASTAPCMISVMRCVKAAPTLWVWPVTKCTTSKRCLTGWSSSRANVIGLLILSKPAFGLAMDRSLPAWKTTANGPTTRSVNPLLRVAPGMLAARTRTSDVLVQQSFRGVPGLRRARPHARV